MTIEFAQRLGVAAMLCCFIEANSKGSVAGTLRLAHHNYVCHAASQTLLRIFSVCFFDVRLPALFDVFLADLCADSLGVYFFCAFWQIFASLDLITPRQQQTATPARPPQAADPTVVLGG